MWGCSDSLLKSLLTSNVYKCTAFIITFEFFSMKLLTTCIQRPCDFTPACWLISWGLMLSCHGGRKTLLTSDMQKAKYSLLGKLPHKTLQNPWLPLAAIIQQRDMCLTDHSWMPLGNGSKKRTLPCTTLWIYKDGREHMVYCVIQEIFWLGKQSWLKTEPLEISLWHQPLLPSS